MNRRKNFKQNLNYLKDNRGFTVPFLAREMDIEKRTLEKYFYGTSVPEENAEAFFSYLKKAFGVTEDQMYSAPDKNIGRIITANDDDEKIKRDLIADIISLLPSLNVNNLGFYRDDIKDLISSKGTVKKTKNS